MAPAGLLLKNETLFWSVFCISKGNKLFLQSAMPASALWEEDLKGQLVLHKLAYAAAGPQ